MTREEIIDNLEYQNEKFFGGQSETLTEAIKTLEQEPDYKSFCEFVAKTIMEEDFELNAGANAEIFCRKLADLGIVKADGDSWVLESEE